jgi:ribosomal-protein-alanine N-acetyltransferase
MKETPTLFGERLILRTWEEGDAPYIYKWCSSPKVTEYLFWHPHRDPSVSERLLSDWMRHKRDYSWAICKKGGRPIGEINVIKDYADGGAEIGYVLLDSEWGHGYMSEALSLVIPFLAGAGYLYVSAVADARNGRSLSLLRKFGFIEQGEGPYLIAKKGERVLTKIMRRELWG